MEKFCSITYATTIYINCESAHGLLLYQPKLVCVKYGWNIQHVGKLLILLVLVNPHAFADDHMQANSGCKSTASSNILIYMIAAFYLVTLRQRKRA